MEKFGAYISGALFAAGWWMWLDAAAWSGYASQEQLVVFGYWVPGIVSTLALVMINIVRWSDLAGESMDDSVQSKARAWFLFSFILAFAALIASIWIAAEAYGVANTSGSSSWPGIACVMQNICILVAALVYRFGPAKDNNQLV